jgi:hypothetical protein
VLPIAHIAKSKDVFNTKHKTRIIDTQQQKNYHSPQQNILLNGRKRRRIREALKPQYVFLQLRTDPRCIGPTGVAKESV